MKDKTLKSNLYHSLREEVQPKRMEETINHCTEIMKEQMLYKEEPRTSFFHYLSDVFRFEGIPIFVLQAVTLFIVCLTIMNVADIPQNIPVFMPLFVLAVLPVLFKSQPPADGSCGARSRLWCSPWAPHTWCTSAW